MVRWNWQLLHEWNTRVNNCEGIKMGSETDMARWTRRDSNSMKNTVILKLNNKGTGKKEQTNC